MNPPSEPPAEPTDAELLQASGAGDRDAFRRLYRRMSKTLYSAAYAFMGNAADAEELMQETFIELWKQAPRYDATRAQPLTYALRIIRNRSFDRLRKANRRGRIAAQSAEDIVDSAHGGPSLGVSEKLRQCESAHAVRQAFHVLTEEQKAALHLAYFGGLSQSEIAAQQSEALGTVKSRIRRGLDKLRQELEGKL